jgi:hypothetical protein
MVERWIITGKGSVDGAIIEVTDGRVSHAPDVLEHWQGREWSWCEKKIESFGWFIKPYIEIDFSIGTS